ncbi:MAG: hypothetical protein Q4D92_06795 [Slackia sp.]|nr:hypothetical protein [Slackia sp.]
MKVVAWMKMRLARLVALCAIALTACVAVVGCTGSGEEGVSYGSCPAAFGAAYEQAEAVVRDQVGDAKVVAVRVSDEIAPGRSPEWMYLFASQEKMGLFTVFSDGNESSVAPVDDEAYVDVAFESIPEVDEVAFDADEAYRLACEAMPEQQGETECSAYMMLSTLDDETQDSAMKWVFTFYPVLSEENGEESGAESDPICSFTVDARTGEVLQRVLE